MRRSLRYVGLSWIACAAWLGCNAILGNESAIFAPDASSTGGEAGADALPDNLPDDARVDGSGDGDADAGVDAGPCIDTDTNPKHCGRCNHDCLGGACVAGRCEPVVLATDVRGPRLISTDGTHVYWTNDETGDVFRVAIDGGSKQLLFDGPTGAAIDFALHGGAIYFAVPELDAGVMTCSSSGCDGGATTVVGGLDVPASILVTDAGELYFAELANPGRIGKCTLPCSSGFAEIESDAAFPSHLATATDGVYWTVILPQPGLRGKLGGAAATTIANGPIEQVVATPDEVFWVEPGNGVRAYARDGGAIRRIRQEATQSKFMALGASDVAFTDTFYGDVFICPRTGCVDGGSKLATAQLGPRGVAFDDTRVYWANEGTNADGGTIMRLAR